MGKILINPGSTLKLVNFRLGHFACLSPAPSNSKRAASNTMSDVEEAPTKRKKSQKATVEDADDEDNEFPDRLNADKVYTVPSSDEESGSDDDAPAKQPSSKSGSSKRVVKDASQRRAKKPQLLKRSDPTTVGADGMLADIDPFIVTWVKGLDKLHRKCNLCGERTVKDLSRHLGKYHAPQYHRWATKNDFESRLEANVKARKAEAAEANKLEQQTLNPHLREKPEHIYNTLGGFHSFLSTQPLGALEHPKFIEMINIVAQATNGVKIPSRKSTRDKIMALFNQQLSSLRTQFRSDKVTGKIHVTCDAWQADNVDGYFAVTTGAGVVQDCPASWDRAPFMRVGYVTCNNATNNGTMLIKFARQFKLATKQQWDPIERHINQSPHFNSHEPTAHIPDTSAVARVIAVKERSSAKRKELFRNIQIRKRPDSAEIARQMVLDMKDVDTFVFEMAQEEGGAAKREKLEALWLRPDEWVRVDLFLNLLTCAKEAQHAFSSDLRSTLHLAIPALEKLHAQWKLASKDAKYEAYWPALAAAMAKVDEYYQKTSNLDAYPLAMVLDPVQKFSHIKTNWDENLQKEALEKTCVPLCYILHSDSDTLPIQNVMNAQPYPVWGSLARGYLVIMSSLASSKRAFSSAGITISDVVEALQVLKCMIQRDLLFRKDTLADMDTEDTEDDTFTNDAGNDLEGWDRFLDDSTEGDDDAEYDI
ncbi:hypothetical protein DFH07DRAFT_992045 [Mycena maculata]|uniref:HAT C-terminal dimerisation domain-containing protein n=1 Tax=Mycena maculata TaxID=230809 RepID=A0AAD7I0B8_9AGAR|nr:hypothetical protein DFH07DRAFT_992045 [Mycena maculata]